VPRCGGNFFSVTFLRAAALNGIDVPTKIARLTLEVPIKNSVLQAQILAVTSVSGYEATGHGTLACVDPSFASAERLNKLND